MYRGLPKIRLPLRGQAECATRAPREELGSSSQKAQEAQKAPKVQKGQGRARFSPLSASCLSRPASRWRRSGTRRAAGPPPARQARWAIPGRCPSGWCRSQRYSRRHERAGVRGSPGAQERPGAPWRPPLPCSGPPECCSTSVSATPFSPFRTRARPCASASGASTRPAAAGFPACRSRKPRSITPPSPPNYCCTCGSAAHSSRATARTSRAPTGARDRGCTGRPPCPEPASSPRPCFTRNSSGPCPPAFPATSYSLSRSR